MAPIGASLAKRVRQRQPGRQVPLLDPRPPLRRPNTCRCVRPDAAAAAPRAWAQQAVQAVHRAPHALPSACTAPSLERTQRVPVAAARIWWHSVHHPPAPHAPGPRAKLLGSLGAAVHVP